MARSLPKTHLAQADYAMHMGLNPVNFEGCTVNGLFQETSGCDSVWPRFSWQTAGNASRNDLAIQISDAEQTIGRYSLGYNVVPEWLELDVEYPAPSNDGMLDIYGKWKTISLQHGKIIAPGRRGLQYIGRKEVVYTDVDGDGFPEVASITLDEEYDWREVKIYHPDTGGDPAWEIRPITKVDKVNFVIRMDSWLFADPELLSAFPKNGSPVIDISNGANLIGEVDVYLEYNDIYSPSVQFIWNNAGEDITQDGYFDVVDHEAGVVRPVPATFTYDLSCVISESGLRIATRPDRIKLWFYSGNVSDNYKRGYTLDPLDQVIAESIRLLATARLDRDLCGCSNIIALGRDLRQDMALVSPQGNFLAVADAIQECPFGTRRGEWLAWNRMKTAVDKFHSVAVI